MSNIVIAPLIVSYSVDDDVLTLYGTAVADSTVTVFDGTTSIGTSTVNADGVWDVTTGAPANSTYSITATDVDAAENISPASSALTVTVNTTPIAVTYFGMTVQSFDYVYGYGDPAEAWPSIPISIARSWHVWSPGNGQIDYLDWSDLNPSAGVYDWTALNAWIAANQANNIQMVYTFGGGPSWAGGAATPNLTAFQAFVTAIVTQADGAIKYWEGFNEFNAAGIAPATVVQLQEIIYNTVHTLDPGALVLSPTVSAAGADPSFVKFLADGGGAYFDIAAFHGYNNDTGEGLISVVQDFQAVLNEYGLGSKPIWDTEWGMEAPNVITNTTAQEAFVSTGLILQWATGVQTQIFYSYENADSKLYDISAGQMTPAGVAYQQTAQWLNGAAEPSGYQLNGSVYTVQLTKNGQSDIIVWNSAGQSSYSAGPYTQYVDVQGQVDAVVDGAVTIGTIPVLLETPLIQPPLITSFSPNGGTGGDGLINATALTLTGTAAANSAVEVYDGSAQLGTVAADASGAWSFATGTLANGSHVFTATDTDAGNVSAASAAFTVTVPIDEINNIYLAVLQRQATASEISEWRGLDQTLGDAGVISNIVSLPEAQNNVYPVIQIIDLATLTTGNFPTAAQLAIWGAYIEGGGVLQAQTQTNPLLDQMAEAFVASDIFGRTYNNGTDVNPNSPVTAREMQVIILKATGTAATPTQINGWVATGLAVDQVFVDFALGDQYTAASKTAIQQYLTEVADNAAGIQVTGIGADLNHSSVAHV